MPSRENATVTSTRMSSRTQIIIAIIGLVSTLTLGYWQFVLKPREQSKSFDIMYAGRVIDANSLLPLSGAKITFYLDGIPRFTYTDSEGLFQFAVTISSLSSGQIRVDAEGYQPYTRNITLSVSVDSMEDIRLKTTTFSLPSETPIVTPTTIAVSIQTSTPPSEASLDVGNHLVQLIDDYYTCINSANRDNRDDYAKCWNLLSNRPDEYQYNLTATKGGLDGFTTFWRDFKVSYALYYCPNGDQQFVDVEYYHYYWDDLAAPTGEKTIIEYTFALGNDGWRIKAGKLLDKNISQFCEANPRIDKFSLFP